MPTDSDLRQLEETFKTGPVVERRQAIHHAAELLASRRCDAYCRGQVIALLESVVANDPMRSIRQRAQTVLDNVGEGLPPGWGADERQHMVEGECAAGHLHYYDKRVICTQFSTVVRSTERDRRSRLLVPCREPGCTHRVTLYVDCEPYR